MSGLGKNTHRNQWVKSGLWLLICFSLVLSSCSGNSAGQSEVEETKVPEIVTALPDESINISDLGLGAASLYGKIDNEELNWEDQPLSQYTVVLVDAVPFLTVQADLSNLQIYETATLAENGEYAIDLPQQPAFDEPLQVMMLTVEDQDCLISGNQLYYCWDAELSSIAFADASQSSVIDGQVLVWAADDQQTFPNSIGADETFFTDDDELEPLEPGYTIIDLGVSPFTFDHQMESDIALYSNYDPSVRDLSELTYTEAFDRIFNDMREGYAFNGVEGKEPDWDAVYELIYPQVQAAEEKEDVNDWISALNAYTQQFSDSHVSISGDVVNDWVEEKTAIGYGFLMYREKDGTLATYYSDPNNEIPGFYKNTGFGTHLARINYIPTEEYLESRTPIFGSYSNPLMYEMATINDMTRESKTFATKVDIEYSSGMRHFIKANVYNDNDTYDHGINFWNVPDEYQIFASLEKSDIGYMAVTDADKNILSFIKSFEYTLEEMNQNGVSNLIIDLRNNHSDNFLNLAGYFVDSSEQLAKAEWHISGNPDSRTRSQSIDIFPNSKKFEFDHIGVLISQNCRNSCEIEAYALGELDNTIIFGSNSTFGSVAVDLGEAYDLPEDIQFNFTVGKIEDESGELFLEGKGLYPDIELLEFLGNTYIESDWRITYVEDYFLYYDELNHIAESSPTPILLDQTDLNKYLPDLSSNYIRNLTFEQYPSYDSGQTIEYTVFVENPDELFVGITYCPNNYIFTNRGKYCADPVVTIDGELISDDYFIERNTYKDNDECYNKLMLLENWEPGTHHITIEVTISIWSVYDGDNSIRKGKYTEEYTVIVKESE